MGRFRKSRDESRVRKYPDDFVVSLAQYHSLYLLSDIQLAEEYVASTPLSGLAMQELVRRYDQYDATAELFAPADMITIDQYFTMAVKHIHIGEVS